MTVEPDVQLDAIAASLNGWLAGIEPARALTLTALRGKGEATGQSNETYFATLVEDGEQPRDVVIRCAPADLADALLPEYDIPLQFEIMAALGTGTDVPVPATLWLERGTEALGVPFYVMEAVPGDIPSDRPPHTVEGFVADAAPGEQERLYRSTIGAMAALGRVDLAALDLPGLPGASGSGSPAAQHLDRYEAIFRWGRQDSGPFPEAERVIAWLRQHEPEAEPVGLLWGDARFANVIYRDYDVVSLLDWELASVGDPVCDLAYFLVHQRANEAHPMPEYRTERLPGFLDDDATVALWEEMAGRPATNLAYYWTFNAFKLVAMMQRWADLAQASGWMPRDVAEAIKVTGTAADEMLRYVNTA